MTGEDRYVPVRTRPGMRGTARVVRYILLAGLAYQIYVLGANVMWSMQPVEEHPLYEVNELKDRPAVPIEGEPTIPAASKDNSESHTGNPVTLLLVSNLALIWQMETGFRVVIEPEPNCAQNANVLVTQSPKRQMHNALRSPDAILTISSFCSLRDLMTMEVVCRDWRNALQEAAHSPWYDLGRKRWRFWRSDPPRDTTGAKAEVMRREQQDVLCRARLRLATASFDMRLTQMDALVELGDEVYEALVSAVKDKLRLDCWAANVVLARCALKRGIREMARLKDAEEGTVYVEDGLIVLTTVANPAVQVNDLEEALNRIAARVKALLVERDILEGPEDYGAGGEPDAVPVELTTEALLVLHEVLFVEMGFAGDRVDYYSPKNTFLDSVLVRRRGLPLSLCFLYAAVARRAGIQHIHVVNMPLHVVVRFDPPLGSAPLRTRPEMATPDPADRGFFVDVFNGGMFTSRTALETRLQGAGLQDSSNPDHFKASEPLPLWLRMLRNLEGIGRRNVLQADEVLMRYVSVLLLKSALGSSALDVLNVVKAISAGRQHCETVWFDDELIMTRFLGETVAEEDQAVGNVAGPGSLFEEMALLSFPRQEEVGHGLVTALSERRGMVRRWSTTRVRGRQTEISMDDLQIRTLLQHSTISRRLVTAGFSRELQTWLLGQLVEQEPRATESQRRAPPRPAGLRPGDLVLVRANGHVGWVGNRLRNGMVEILDRGSALVEGEDSEFDRAGDVTVLLHEISGPPAGMDPGIFAFLQTQPLGWRFEEEGTGARLQVMRHVGAWRVDGGFMPSLWAWARLDDDERDREWESLLERLT